MLFERTWVIWVIWSVLWFKYLTMNCDLDLKVLDLKCGFYMWFWWDRYLSHVSWISFKRFKIYRAVTKYLLTEGQMDGWPGAYNTSFWAHKKWCNNQCIQFLIPCTFLIPQHIQANISEVHNMCKLYQLSHCSLNEITTEAACIVKANARNSK